MLNRLYLVQYRICTGGQINSKIKSLFPYASPPHPHAPLLIGRLSVKNHDDGTNDSSSLAEGELNLKVRILSVSPLITLPAFAFKDGTVYHS